MDSELDECRYCIERNNLTIVRIINSNSVGALCSNCLKNTCSKIVIISKPKEKTTIESARESLLF